MGIISLCSTPSKKKKTKKMTTTTTYDGTAKSAFGSGNVEGQSSVEVFLMTLFVLESVGIRCRPNRRRPKSQVEENEDATLVSSSSSLPLGERWKDFRFVLLPTIACVFHPRASAVLGVCACARRTTRRVLMFRNQEEEKEEEEEEKDSKRTKRENEDDTSWFNLYRSIMLLSACSVILAIDFSQTPRRLGKMKEYGVSVMDVGVGSFVFSASCVKWRSSSRRRRRRRRSRRSRRSRSNSSSTMKTILNSC